MLKNKQKNHLFLRKDTHVNESISQRLLALRNFTGKAHQQKWPLPRSLKCKWGQSSHDLFYPRVL